MSVAVRPIPIARCRVHARRQGQRGQRAGKDNGASSPPRIRTAADRDYGVHSTGLTTRRSLSASSGALSWRISSITSRLASTSRRTSPKAGTALGDRPRVHQDDAGSAHTTCFRDARLKATPEGWQSGRMRRSRKPLSVQADRRFKSSPLRFQGRKPASHAGLRRVWRNARQSTEVRRSPLIAVLTGAPLAHEIRRCQACSVGAGQAASRSFV